MSERKGPNDYFRGFVTGAFVAGLAMNVLIWVLR